MLIFETLVDRPEVGEKAARRLDALGDPKAARRAYSTRRMWLAGRPESKKISRLRAGRRPGSVPEGRPE
jgi:hypothetical protein